MSVHSPNEVTQWCTSLAPLPVSVHSPDKDTFMSHMIWNSFPQAFTFYNLILLYLEKGGWGDSIPSFKCMRDDTYEGDIYQLYYR
jgi:hypothetical protein